MYRFGFQWMSWTLMDRRIHQLKVSFRPKKSNDFGTLFRSCSSVVLVTLSAAVYPPCVLWKRSEAAVFAVDIESCSTCGQMPVIYCVYLFESKYRYMESMNLGTQAISQFVWTCLNHWIMHIYAFLLYFVLEMSRSCTDPSFQRAIFEVSAVEMAWPPWPLPGSPRAFEGGEPEIWGDQLKWTKPEGIWRGMRRCKVHGVLEVA